MYKLAAFVFIFFLFLGCKKSNNPTPQTGWVQLKSFSGGSRADAMAFTINGVAYVGAGLNYSNNKFIGYSDLWQYDPLNDSWTQKSSIPPISSADPYGGRANPFNFVIGGQVYLGGGSTNFFLPGFDMLAYNPSLDQWTLKNTLFTGALALSYATVYKNIAYIIGQNGNDIAMYTYDPSNNQFLRSGFVVTTISQGALYSWSAATSDKLLLGSSNSDVSFFHPGDIAATLLTNYSINVGSFSVSGKSIFSQPITYKNNIYQSFGTAGELYRFDLTANTWTKVGISQTNLGIQDGAACFNIGSKLYIVGGTTAGLFSQYTDAVWMLDLDKIPQ